ncbi:hypothetical protein J0S82_018329 [Galemys pyrenaicus]|uniref:Uncharacterized protein n=1 Tax=Galemys pyrenaicus TaxID=202257 RepID=A0A8J6B9H2_GALPY|nr:hypothetical protein J0S82_018329 [Galemys pyrenaicus]
MNGHTVKDGQCFIQPKVRVVLETLVIVVEEISVVKVAFVMLRQQCEWLYLVMMRNFGMVEATMILVITTIFKFWTLERRKLWRPKLWSLWLWKPIFCIKL